MKFAEILKNAGMNPQNFPKSSEIKTFLYDGKDRISSEENINYVEPFFKHNDGSFLNFQHFVNGIEQETIESMNVKVDITSVILFYKTPRAIVFLRNPSMNPIDYME